MYTVNYYNYYKIIIRVYNTENGKFFKLGELFQIFYLKKNPTNPTFLQIWLWNSVRLDPEYLINFQLFAREVKQLLIRFFKQTLIYKSIPPYIINFKTSDIRLLTLTKLFFINKSINIFFV